jgi:hypothetical protein
MPDVQAELELVLSQCLIQINEAYMSDRQPAAPKNR